MTDATAPSAGDRTKPATPRRVGPPAAGEGPRPRFGWPAKVITALVSTLLTVLVCEVAVRMTGLAPAFKSIDVTGNETVYQRSSNPMLGFELKANYRDENADARQSYASTNAHGQRDVERDVEKPPGSTRVILLGDSVVEGHGIARIDDTMSRQLERLHDDGTEVLNFGVSAYCTRAEVELLEVKGLQFQPDVVILLFVENDFDNFNAETWELGSAGARPAVVRHLFRHSDLFRLACVRLNLFGFGVEADPVAWNTQAMGHNNVVEGLERLGELADAHGFEPIIAVWPRFDDGGITDVHFMPDGGDELVIERLAKMHGFRTVRLSDYFRRHRTSARDAANPRLQYTDGDGLHPSIAGCRVAAQALKTLLDEASSEPARAPARPAGEDAAAVEAARAFGTANPGYSITNTNRGNEFLAQGKLDEAIRHFRLALEEDPDGAEAHCNLGLAFVSQGKLDEAVEHYRRAVEIKPDFVIARSNLGNALAMRGEAREAIAHYRAAARIQPDHAGTQNNWGRALASLGELEEAILHYRRAIEIDSTYVVARINLGYALVSRGSLDEASDEFRAALRAQPDSAVAETGWGRVLAMQGKLDEAMPHLRRALKIDPGAVSAATNLANGLMEQGDLDQAIVQYRRALEISADYVMAHYNLGIALSRTGQLDGALEHFREAARLRPAWPPALSRTAWTLATRPASRDRDHAEAIRLAEHAAELTGRRVADVLDTLAASYAAAGRFDDAVTTAERALAAATAGRETELAAEIRARLALYRAGRPFLQPVTGRGARRP